MPIMQGQEPVLNAANAWKEKCLIGDGSLFSNEQLWTKENIEALKENFTDNPLDDKRKFEDKLIEQLKNTTTQVQQLAAEMLWVLYLFVHKTAMRPETKQSNIKKIWGLSGAKFNDSFLVNDDVLSGIGNPGQAYSQGRWRELNFLIYLSISLRKLTSLERYNVLSSAASFAVWLDTQNDAQNRQFRHIVLFLLFPGMSVFN